MDIKTYGIRPLDRTRIISDYINDIRKYPVLSEKEEDELIVRIKNGDEEAREKLIKYNLKFVLSIAKCYASDDKLSDLISEGNMGLITAIDYYDVNFENRFLSYAVWYIRRSINAYLTNYNFIVKRTNNQKINTKLHNVKNKYYCENGRYPTEGEVLDILEKEYGVKIKCESDLYEVKSESINETYDDDASNTYEFSKEYIEKTANENNFIKKENTEYNKFIIDNFLSVIKERDRKIIKMYFGIGCEENKNYKEIGEEVGLTSERVRQIIENSLNKMRKANFLYK